MTFPWITKPLGQTALNTGPCIWSAHLLGHRPDLLRSHPSAVYFGPDDGPLRQPLAHGVRDSHVIVCVRNPEFARHLEQLVHHTLRELQRPRIDALVLQVEAEPTSLKGGRELSTLFAMRDAGLIGDLGLSHEDPLAIEWFALHTAVRLLVFPHHLHNQWASFRAVPAAHDHGMACVSTPQPVGWAMIRFALCERHGITPVLDDIPDDDLTPMNQEEFDAAWAEFALAHSPPPPLDRGGPE